MGENITRIETLRVTRNIIIDNGLLAGDEIARYFGNAKTKTIPLKKKDGGRHTMYDILVMAGVYRTTEAARRAWTKTNDVIPGGLNTYNKFTKNKVIEITIYMPTITLN